MRRFNPIRYVILLSVGVKVACLVALLMFWSQLPRWFSLFAGALLVITIAVQGRLLWKQRR
jgi:hypothetical protein